MFGKMKFGYILYSAILIVLIVAGSHPVIPVQAQTTEPTDEISLEILSHNPDGSTTVAIYGCGELEFHLVPELGDDDYDASLVAGVWTVTYHPNIKWGTLEVWTWYPGGTYLTTLRWSQQWYNFVVPNHAEIGDIVSIQWERHNSGNDSSFTTLIPEGISIPGWCTGLGECSITHEFSGGYPDQLFVENIQPLKPGIFPFTAVFTETVSGFTSTITGTLTVYTYLFLPTISK